MALAAPCPQQLLEPGASFAEQSPGFACTRAFAGDSLVAVCRDTDPAPSHFSRQEFAFLIRCPFCNHRVCISELRYFYSGISVQAS